MLQNIHDRIHGWIAWVIIIIIAITFTLFGIDYYIGSRAGSQAKVEVNDQPISEEQFRVTYRRVQQNQQGPMTASAERLLKRQVLQKMIMDKVVLQAATNNGFTVTEQQAESALMGIPAFQDDGQFSAEKFQLALSSALYTPETFINQLKEGMLSNQQRFSIVGSAFVLPGELDQFIKLADQTRDFDYLLIPSSKFKSQVKVTADEVKDYYGKHQKQFMTEEKVALNYVLLSMKKVTDSIDISDKQLQQYYQENSASYRQPAEYKIAHILIKLDKNADEKAQQAALTKAQAIEAKLAKGESFATLAKAESDDLLSARKGGELSWMRAGSLGEAYDAAIIALKTKGDISAPVKTPYGYEIIKLMDKRAPQEIPFADVKQSIKQGLVIEKAQQLFAQESDELTDLSYQNPESLTTAAKALGLTIKSTPLFSRQGLKVGVAASKSVVKVAFSNEVLAEGNNSQPMPLNDDGLIVIRVAKHVKPQAIPLAEVRDKIRAIIEKQQQDKLARAYSEKLLAAYADKKAFDALSAKESLQWVKEQGVRRGAGDKLDAKIVAVAFDTKLPKTGQAALQRIELSNGDTALLLLKKISHGKVDSIDKEQREIIAGQIETAQGIKDYDMFVAGLMKNADIVRH